jgi:beta-aspartyl-peptidase (threonine type)
MMLVAAGAERFAAQQGISLCNPEELIAPAEREAWAKCKVDVHAAAFHQGHEQGTVGAVAVDRDGRLFAATSTGGTCCKLPGRVGDSPLIGCGCYADSEAGGASCTGYGEAIMKIVMAKTATDFLRHSSGHSNAASTSRNGEGQLTSSMSAAAQAVALLAQRTKGTGGLILLDRNGNPGWAFNTPRMAYGYVQQDGNFFTAV